VQVLRALIGNMRYYISVNMLARVIVMLVVECASAYQHSLCHTTWPILLVGLLQQI